MWPLFLRKRQVFDWEKIWEKLKPVQKTIDVIAKEYEKYRFHELRSICRNTPSIVNARIVLRETIFKNGLEWIPKFASKCIVCGEEFENKTETCDKCKGSTREPDQAQRNYAETFFKDVNEYSQSLLDVLQNAEDEVNMVDQAFLWLDMEYELLEFEEGKYNITGSKVTTIEEIPPEHIKHNLNKATGRHKEEEWFCFKHRGVVYNEKGFCTQCGAELLLAWYIYKYQNDVAYYARYEIIDWTFYDPHGYSPIYAILKNILVEWGMDDELWERYWNKKLPKDIIAVVTSNVPSLEKVKSRIIEDAKKGEVPFVGIESVTGRGSITKVPLMDDSVADLTNIGTRNQIKKIINTVYGIVPLYSADAERSSALSGEGQQLNVQEDRAQAKQMVYNSTVLPQLMFAMHVTDWELQLKPPTEESELKILEIDAQRITNAKLMLDMGFDVTLTDSGEFTFSGTASRPDVVMPSPFAASKENNSNRGIRIIKDNIGEYLIINNESGFEDVIRKARWEEVIDAIRHGALWQGYEGLAEDEVIKLNAILESHFTRPYVSLKAISEEIVEKLGLPESRARLIGRTEMTAVVNKAREIDYEERDPEGEWLYKWLNPVDSRTTKQCRELVERTKNGVTLTKLKELCKEVAEKYAEGGFRYVRDWVTHFGCRSTYARKIA